MKILENNSERKRRVAIYIRVSTSEQKIDGYGLEAQEKKLLDYVKNNPGLNYINKPEWIYRDTHTGSELNREELNKLREAVRAGKYDAVLVWKIDRLSRSLKHLLMVFEELEKHEVSFISVQENLDFKGPIGRMIFQIFGAIAQFERELIKGRTNMGKMASAAMGNFTGTSVPYGYKKVTNANKKGGKLVIMPEEKKWVEKMFDWYIFDGLGLGQIAKKLNSLKVPRGKHATKAKHSPWSVAMLRRIIHSPVYRGVHIANKKDDNGNLLSEKDWTITKVPPCVSELTYLQAQEIRHDKKGGRVNVAYLLSGKLKDMTLAKPKTFVGVKRHKGGYSYRRKQFDKGGTHYPVFEAPAKVIEEYVWKKVLEALKSPEIFIQKYLSQQYADPERIKTLQAELDNKRKEKADNDLARERVEEAYERGSYSSEKMEEKLRDKDHEDLIIENRIQEIEDELKVISSISVEVGKLREASAQIRYKLDNLSQQHKKTLINLFINRIEMRRVKQDNRWQISAQIYFRFNPNKFPSNVVEGRTGKELQLKQNAQKLPDEGNFGARERT